MKPGSTKQLPDQAILDFYNKQTYLGNSFVASSGVVAGTGSEAALLVISNPAANTFQNGQAGSLGCFLNLRSVFCDVGSAAPVFNLYLNPTSVSSGTAVTPVNLRPAWGTVSKMVVTKTPTVGGNGTLITPLFVGTDNLLFVLDPGYSILITQKVSAANVIAELSWYEI